MADEIITVPENTTAQAVAPAINEKKYYPWTFPLFFGFGLLLAFLLAPVIDNDTWWILALGKNITANGIPTVEPLAMHEGLDFVAQQWLSSVIYRGVYDVFGYVGLAALCRILDFAILFLLFKLCRVIGLESKASAIATVFAGVPLIITFGVLRPQLFTFVILLSLMILLEKYAQTNKWQWLIPLPFLSAIEINLHSSMWFMIPVFMLPFIAEWFHMWIVKLIKHKNYQEWLETKSVLPRTRFNLIPLAAAFILVLAAGLCNPYGLKAITYVFRSYGVDIINSMVTEMVALSIRFAGWAFVYVIIGVVMICLTRKRLPIRYVCLVIGCTYLSFTAAKCFAYFLMFVVPVIAYCYAEKSEKLRILKKPFLSAKYKKVLTIILVIVAVVVVFGKDVFTNATEDITDKEMYGCKETLEYAEKYTGISKDSSIFAGYNTGGYLEFMGYKPYLDARAEVFLKENNLKKDYLTEYANAEYKGFGAVELLETYNFDYIFIETDSAIYMWLERLNNEGIGNYTQVCQFKDALYTNADPLSLWVRNDLAEGVRIDDSVNPKETEADAVD